MTPNNQTEVMDALVNIGPLAILVASDGWEFYESGIFDGCPKTSGNIDLDHVVVLVGYGEDSKGNLYWIVRNSWDTNYGEKGYIRVKRDSTPKCGKDTTPSHGNACKGDDKPETVCG